ncbi:LolC/E family lipoprotein releasing system, protein [Terasakiella brassicae]|uniref:LolC/E family lipoprotein releasing system, protein n=1 Tax=Terasakiella brassicae TaxID=1634917 RepID=A0A917F6B5_9PROT|nr:lipoprotein-releasing ABC transporter permease subunit [Terasakiella brassicae]GGF52115.1 LolC/E family lipoprotein releasing system, protein [Terasakiella brassicae]
MFKAFEWMMAARYLRARRREGFVSVIAWFSLLGIALGVATLIIVMSVMNGFREELLSRILGINGHINVYGQTRDLTDYTSLSERLSQIDGVVSVTPTIEGQVMATGQGASSGAMVRGLTGDDFKKRKLLFDSLKAGSMDLFNQDQGVIVGARLAQKLGLWVGDKITLISPKGNITAFGTVPRMRSFTIAATFDVGMYEYDSSFIFMPLNAAQNYFRMKGVNYLEVMAPNADSTDQVTYNIMTELGRFGVNPIDWKRTNSSFFNALQVERNVMFMILTLIIIVAAFNIISGLIMLVKDKGKDIAILRTMGASRGSIMRIFLIAGASVGVFGTILGFILGLAFAENIETIRRWIETLSGNDLFAAEIYFLSKLPAIVDYGEVSLVVAMGLGLSFLATLYPSWRAARLDPVEALRYE